MNENTTPSRLKFSLKLSLTHLLASCIIASMAGFAVYFILYPYPYYLLLDVSAILLILIVVDIVCGPLLTAIISTPQKKKRLLYMDIGLISIVQLSALMLGLYTVYIARPVAIAFEIDRFVVIQASDIDRQQLSLAPEGLQTLPLTGTFPVGTRKHKNQEEFFELAELADLGISPGMYPKWWTHYDLVRSDITAKAKPLSSLIAQYPDNTALIKNAIPNGMTLEQLSYLPLTRAYNTGWTAVLNPQASIVAHIPLDGFD